jgi:hypothetical protein
MRIYSYGCTDADARVPFTALVFHLFFLFFATAIARYTFDGKEAGMVISDRQLRQVAAGLGLATALFGMTPIVLPQQFARLFGFSTPDPATASLMRSLGVRDAVAGMGLWSAAAHGGKYTPWLLGRLLTDGGDALAITLAAARGERNPRFLMLGALALGAALFDAGLYLAARRVK